MIIPFLASILAAPFCVTATHSLADVHISSPEAPLGHVSGIYIPSTPQNSVRNERLIAGTFTNDCEIELSSKDLNSTWVLFVEYSDNCSIEKALSTEAAGFIFISSLTASEGNIYGSAVPSVLISSSSGKELSEAINRTAQPLFATFLEFSKPLKIMTPSHVSKTLFDIGIVLGVVLFLSVLLALTIWTRKKRRNAIVAAVVDSEKRQERKTADALKALPIIEYKYKPQKDQMIARRTSPPYKQIPGKVYVHPRQSTCIDVDSTVPKDKIEEEEADCCAICYDDFANGDTQRQLPCDHSRMFHLGCVDKWLLLNRKCPICKMNFMYPSGVGRYKKATNTDGTEIDIESGIQTSLR
ncbi:hypothetical protein SARC_09126 [Sphaeroforma arctica JP610]|uniref:RING-type domain-containing protein n=1 Tax=Sphaeroforma arctica JP610 TaxID=667725 RepID=A0A0L0FR03_9EUKA|nr:hypothetical protein SARC_09126 [Sphaeroforma arctica JP610]KNC78438.1 hypothetical protein SARC_09126 [Sphaeroforma arctica JP610]|eukprot:XP_014152340.1 hypothetical protein SARC_09126 [Sphaeroforma arctica JP610]